MINIIKKFFDPSQKIIRSVQPIVAEINSFKSEFEKKSDEELKEIITKVRGELKPLIEDIPPQFKTSLKAPNRDRNYVMKEEKVQSTLLKNMPVVYAAVREMLRRKTGYSHFDVQLTASVILAQGYRLAEAKTGEGKTLVFQLPAALYGLTGRGSHFVTVNDYLARRDGEYAGHILHDLGITVGVVTPDGSYRFVSDDEAGKLKGEEIAKKIAAQKIKNPGDCDGLNIIECTKKEAYNCDVVYGTNNEFGFDYLRDNMTSSIDAISQRELYFCIVDEADSILIDEARTPLIISAAAEKSNDLYVRFAGIVPKLKQETDFTVDEKAHSVMLTDEGAEKMEKLLGVKNIWQDYKLAHHLENALKAEYLYKNDIHYLVGNGEVKIVDQFTGRVLEGRRYSEGLHQAIEAKEGVEIKRESKTLGTITFQNFFRLYKILSGGSGTVMTESEEFYQIYNLTSVEIPTNKPVVRVDHTDRVYKNREMKFNAVVGDIVELHEKGQPILVGTTSIEDSEYVSKLLEMKGIAHEVLNAKYHERESKIVANAGKKGAVTVATNMAGRGTDIKLGGKNATDEEFEEVVKTGGLAVFGTQRHESRRIDNQLRGRSGRQGEPGMTRFYVALDDEIMRIQGGEFVQRILEMTNIPDDTPIEARIIGRQIESAQKRMEGMHFDSRKTVVEYDDVVNQQREIFYSRRRRILEEIETAQKNIKNDSPDKFDEIKSVLKEKLDRQIDEIVKKHFFVERQDDIDIKKVVEDFIEISHDVLVKNAINKLNLDSSSRKAHDVLIEIFAGKDQEFISQRLHEIADQLFADKVVEFGDDLPMVAKALVLRTMDELWTEQLDAMRALRDGIGLRGFAQKDPLVEYKNEGFEIFDIFINKIDSEIARQMLKIQRVVQSNVTDLESEQIQTNAEQVKDVNTGTREISTRMDRLMKNQAIKASVPGSASSRPARQSIDISRNDKVSVRYQDGTIVKDVKFKKVEADVRTGKCVVIERG